MVSILSFSWLLSSNSLQSARERCRDVMYLFESGSSDGNSPSVASGFSASTTMARASDAARLMSGCALGVLTAALHHKPRPI